MPKLAKNSVQTSAIAKKKQAPGGKARFGVQKGTVSAAAKADKLKENLSCLKKFGIKPSTPTQIFTQWEKGFFAIDRSQLVSLGAAPFDLETCRADKDRKWFTDAMASRDNTTPLTIGVTFGPFNSQLEAHTSDMHWQSYKRGENGEACDHFPIDGDSPPCFSTDDVLAMYAGQVALAGKNGVVPFVTLFMLTGWAPIALKAGKAYDEEATALFDRHREKIQLALQKMFLLYPTKVDPMVDAKGTAFAEGELDRAVKANRQPKPLTVPFKDGKVDSANVLGTEHESIGAPCIAFFVDMDVDTDGQAPNAPKTGASATTQQGAHARRRLYVAPPVITKKLRDLVQQFGLEKEFPGLAKLSDRRCTSMLPMEKWRQYYINSMGPNANPPGELTDDGEFDADWCKQRLALPFGFPYVEQLSDEVRNGVVQEERDDKGNPVLVPLFLNSPEAHGGVVWRDMTLLEEGEYKERVAVAYKNLVGAKAMPKVGSRNIGGGGAAKTSRGGGGGGGDTVSAAAYAALEQENAKLKEEIAQLKAGAGPSLTRLDIGLGPVPGNKVPVVFCANEDAKFKIVRTKHSRLEIAPYGMKPIILEGTSGCLVRNLPELSPEDEEDGAEPMRMIQMTTVHTDTVTATPAAPAVPPPPPKAPVEPAPVEPAPVEPALSTASTSTLAVPAPPAAAPVAPAPAADEPAFASPSPESEEGDDAWDENSVYRDGQRLMISKGEKNLKAIVLSDDGSETLNVRTETKGTHLTITRSAVLRTLDTKWPDDVDMTEAPAEAPTEALAEAPTEAPAEAPAEEPAEAPAEEPAEAPAKAPAEEPAEEPAEAPAAAEAEAPVAEAGASAGAAASGRTPYKVDTALFYTTSAGKSTKVFVVEDTGGDTLTVLVENADNGTNMTTKVNFAEVNTLRRPVRERSSEQEAEAEASQPVAKKAKVIDEDDQDSSSSDSDSSDSDDEDDDEADKCDSPNRRFGH
jgi:hypothetical protein